MAEKCQTPRRAYLIFPFSSNGFGKRKSGKLEGSLGRCL